MNGAAVWACVALGLGPLVARRRSDDHAATWQSIAEGLGVRGPITSPTFVISRVHPSLVGGPSLVHGDAYRLGSAVELDDLDLDADLDASVVIVEWGAGLAEQLSDTRLELTLSGDLERSVHAVAVGPRFEHVLAELSPWVA